MTYPNGRIVRYEYRAGDDNVLCRPRLLADDASGGIGTHLTQLSYEGFKRDPINAL